MGQTFRTTSPHGGPVSRVPGLIHDVFATCDVIWTRAFCKFGESRRYVSAPMVGPESSVEFGIRRPG